MIQRADDAGDVAVAVAIRVFVRRRPDLVTCPVFPPDRLARGRRRRRRRRSDHSYDAGGKWGSEMRNRNFYENRKKEKIFYR